MNFEETAQNIIDLTLKAGASDCDVVLAKSHGKSISCRFQKIEELDESKEKTIGIRALVDQRQAFVSSSDIETDNVDKLVSRDFSANNGDFGKGSVVAIGGVPVIKSNTAVDAYVNSSTDSATGQNNDYLVNASDVVATIFQRGAIGTVKRKDLTLESTYDPRRMGTLMTARMMVGHNILRPECAVSINKS